jgi:putative ABC transport system permease protein
MFFYYLELARRSLARNALLTALMIVAIAFGIGASMTTLTVLHVLAADPIPGKSGALYRVQLDPEPSEGFAPGVEPEEQVGRLDAEALVRAARADRQALMVGVSAPIEPARPGLEPFFVDGRATTADFFAMFRVPFVAGGGWSRADDDAAARVAVIDRALAERLFGEAAVVGRALRVGGAELRIVGVTDGWNPNPHFYDLTTGSYGAEELLYTPFSTSRAIPLSRRGSMNCYRPAPDPEAVDAPCAWLQLWVELGSAAQADAYRAFLVHYSADQRAAGRYERPPNARLRDVMSWLAYKRVVPDDARLQTWIALGFLLVCLVNTVGLLLTKFLRRSAEIGVRRALGASRRAIFVQLLVEAGVVGLIGGALGLGLAALGLWAVRHQHTDYAALATLDLPMLAATFALAVVASLCAGVLPAWRGCQVTPAVQLKSH